MLYITTLLQQWTKRYLTDVIQLSETEAEFYFVLFCITAPPLGILTGGCIVQKLGGYQNINSLYIILINTFILTVLAIIIGIVLNKYIFGLALWSYLFFGSMIDPCIYGSLLSTLPKELKGSGYTLQYISSSIIGVSVAPFMYGVIYENTKMNYPTMALSICLSIPSIACILVRSILSKSNQKALNNEEVDYELNRNSEAKDENGNSEAIQSTKIITDTTDRMINSEEPTRKLSPNNKNTILERCKTLSSDNSNQVLSKPMIEPQIELTNISSSNEN